MPTEYEDLYGYNNGPRCSPVVDGDRVYAYRRRWHARLLPGGRRQAAVADRHLNKSSASCRTSSASAARRSIEGDLLIVMVGGSPPESQQVAPGALDRVEPNGSGIVAFDKLHRRGEVQAGRRTGQLCLAEAGHDRRSPLVLCVLRGGLVGFEPATGKLDFHYPWRAKILESSKTNGTK